MKHSLSYSGDPNTNHNLLPEKTEPDTLRKLAQCDEETIRELDRKIEQGEEDCDSIQQRFDALIPEVKRVQSELAAARSSVYIFKDQKHLIQYHLDQLNELMYVHPIQRCPSEILQDIFEWTYDLARNPFKASTTLSHVCHRWREIALKTPYLWTKAVVSLNHKPKAVKAFWSRTVERAKIAPMTVVIQDMTGSAAQWSNMKEAPLDLFAHIVHLEFQVFSTKANNRLHSREYRVPTCPVDHLMLNWNEPENKSILYTSFLENFSSLKSLTLNNVHRISWISRVSIPTITRLEMWWVADVPLRSLMDTFPNIQELAINYVRFLEGPAEETSFPKLRLLRVSGRYGVPWRGFKAPSLTHLIFDQKVTDEFLAFVSSHRSIQNLDTGHSTKEAETVISAAHQVTELTIVPYEELCDRAITELTNLRNLVLYHYEDGPLSMDLFERIVQSRFLPLPNSGREAKENTKAMPSLTILIFSHDKSNKLEWRANPLLSSASEIIKKIHRWNFVYDSYTYTWT